MDFRIEKDSLGDVPVPSGAYWGSQAERSRNLFQISGLTEHPKMIDAYILLKKACTQANTELGLLDKEIGNAIVQAADEILGGRLRDQFPVDVFHMGAGTSFNMNCNEVLANRAEEILGGTLGEYSRVNPNDHPNYGQSTNDTFPSAMRIMSRLMLEDLFPAVDGLIAALEAKGREFDHILKSARTHLQDAVPIRLGQEFTAYAVALRKARRWLGEAAFELEELGIGGSHFLFPAPSAPCGVWLFSHGFAMTHRKKNPSARRSCAISKRAVARWKQATPQARASGSAYSRRPRRGASRCTFSAEALVGRSLSVGCRATCKTCST